MIPLLMASVPEAVAYSMDCGVANWLCFLAGIGFVVVLFLIAHHFFKD